MTPRYLTRASAVVLVALAVAGCDWRLETPPPNWPSPDPVTEVRDAAAEREQRVIDSADDFDGAGTPTYVVLNEIETAHSPVRLDALGGVYVAYPDASPSPTEDAGEASPSLPEAVAAARDGHLADAFATDDDDLALLLASAGLSHALSAWYATWVTDAIGAADQPVVAERLVPSDALAEAAGLIPATASISTDTLAELALAHDQARYAYEVMAARAVEEEREQWLARRDIQAARGEALTGLTGVSDLREATYVVLGGLTVDPAVRIDYAREVETTLAATYASLLAQTDAAQWPWLLNAAFDAYAQAAVYGEPTAADYEVPPLPGIDVG